MIQRDIKIIDNFLEPSYFNELGTLLNSDKFSWFIGKEISNSGEVLGNLYYQTHTLFINYQICSEFFDKFTPMLDKLNVKSLIRLRTNLYPGREKLYEHGWHTDYNYKNKTALLYINNNDGYTKFKDGTKVKSVANRILIFDSSEEHLSTNCTNDWARCNININYF